jgi:hypothetical protein
MYQMFHRSLKFQKSQKNRLFHYYQRMFHLNQMFH